jgi:hypothetical protein
MKYRETSIKSKNVFIPPETDIEYIFDESNELEKVLAEKRKNQNGNHQYIGGSVNGLANRTFKVDFPFWSSGIVNGTGTQVYVIKEYEFYDDFFYNLINVQRY